MSHIHRNGKITASEKYVLGLFQRIIILESGAHSLNGATAKRINAYRIIPSGAMTE